MLEFAVLFYVALCPLKFATGKVLGSTAVL